MKNLTVKIRGSYTDVFYQFQSGSISGVNKVAYKMTAEKLNNKTYPFKVEHGDIILSAELSFSGTSEIVASAALFNVGFTKMEEINELLDKGWEFVQKQYEEMVDFLEKVDLYNKVKPPATNEVRQQIEKLFNEIELLKETKSDKRRNTNK